MEKLFEIKTVYHTAHSMNNIFVEIIEAKSESLAKQKAAEIVKENAGKVDIVYAEVLETA